MIRLMDGFDPPTRLAEGELAPVDFLPLRHHPRDGAQAGGDPRRPRRRKGGERVLEHPLIELVRLAVHVDVGPRIPGGDEGYAKIAA